MVEAEEVDHRAAETVEALALKVTVASKHTKMLSTLVTTILTVVAVHMLRATTTMELQSKESEARKKI